MSDELKIGYISKQCLEKLQNPKWQALRGVWVELWTVDGPPSRCVVPVYTFSKNASAQAVDNSSDDLQPMQPGPFVYSAEVEIKGLRTQLATMTAERDAALAKVAALREALQYVDWRLYFDGSEGRYVAKDDYDGNVIDAALEQTR